MTPHETLKVYSPFDRQADQRNPDVGQKGSRRGVEDCL